MNNHTFHMQQRYKKNSCLDNRNGLHNVQYFLDLLDSQTLKKSLVKRGVLNNVSPYRPKPFCANIIKGILEFSIDKG